MGAPLDQQDAKKLTSSFSNTDLQSDNDGFHRPTSPFVVLKPTSERSTHQAARKSDHANGRGGLWDGDIQGFRKVSGRPEGKAP